jgi:hypothetical protein
MFGLDLEQLTFVLLATTAVAALSTTLNSRKSQMNG